MELISTSRDIFYLVLSFCILWITIFFAWLMYYAIGTVRQIYHTVTEVKRRIEAVDEIIRLVKEKIIGASSYVAIIASGVGKLISLFSSDSDKAASGRKKKKAS